MSTREDTDISEETTSATGSHRWPSTLNRKQLAEKTGFSTTHISAAVKCGYRFKYGKRTREKDFLDWIEDNPDFRITQAYPKRSQDAKARVNRRTAPRKLPHQK